MWILHKDGEEYKLLVGKEYVVGRKDADIILNNDQSISRKHAVITVKTATTSSSQALPGPMLRDLSKYGTSVNGVKVQNSSADQGIANGDVIHFGVFDNLWTIVHRPLTCSTSCFSGAEKRIVQELLSSLGGQVLAEWTDNCTLLIMDKLTVTIKVISALLSLKRIVTSQYLKDMVEAARKQEQDPDPSRYLPTFDMTEFLNETIDFGPKDARKTLFTAMTFVSFASKQVKKMTIVMKQAGAQLKLQPPSSSILEEWLVQDGVCVLQPPPNSVPLDFEGKLVSFLKIHDKRCIPEAEVGLAVLHCSCSRYCKPSYSAGSDQIVPSSMMHDTQTASQIRCAETQVDIDNEEEVRETEDTVPWTLPPNLIPKAPASQPMFSSAATSSCYLLTEPKHSSPSPFDDMDIVDVIPMDEPVEPAEDNEPKEPQDKGHVVADHDRGDTKQETEPKITNRTNNTTSSEIETDLTNRVRNGVMETSSESLVIIKYVSLVRPRKNLSSRSIGDNHLPVKNFKRFKKIQPKNSLRDVGGDYRTADTGVGRRPRLEMLQRATQSQISNFSQNDNSQDQDDDDDDDQGERSNRAELFDW